MRQELNISVCLRPVRYYQGTPSPVKHPELTDMVIFMKTGRHLCGYRMESRLCRRQKVIKFLREEMGVKKEFASEH